MSVRVGILYGSASDHDKMVKAAAILERFGVGFEIAAMSAHRSPDRVHEYATTAEERGIEVIIAGAGMAAHLAGVCAALTGNIVGFSPAVYRYKISSKRHYAGTEPTPTSKSYIRPKTP